MCPSAQNLGVKIAKMLVRSAEICGQNIDHELSHMATVSLRNVFKLAFCHGVNGCESIILSRIT